MNEISVRDVLYKEGENDKDLKERDSSVYTSNLPLCYSVDEVT